MLQPEDCGRTIAFVASMPPRVCMQRDPDQPDVEQGFCSDRRTIGISDNARPTQRALDHRARCVRQCRGASLHARNLRRLGRPLGRASRGWRDRPHGSRHARKSALLTMKCAHTAVHGK